MSDQSVKWFRNKKYYRLSFLVLITCFILYFVFILRQVLLPFIIGFLVAYVLNPAVKALESRKISRLLSIAIVFIGVLGFFSIIGIFGFPKIIAELNKFAEEIPFFTRKIQGLVENIQEQYNHSVLPESLRHVIDETIDKGENVILDVVTSTVNSILGLFSHLFSLFLSPIVAFYILKDMEKIKNSFFSALPKRYRSDVLGLVRDIDEVVFKFIKGNLLVAVLVGLLIGVGMTFIGVRFGTLIGIIAGITNFIPFIGAWIGAVPAVLVALLQSEILALYTIILIFIVQQLEGNVISPKILGDSVGLHPLWVIFALLAGGQLMGVIGMIIAVPVAAILKVITRFIYLKLVG